MPPFELEVLSLKGSWVVKLDGRVVSGSATLPTAERVARSAADSLTRSGYGVSLKTPSDSRAA